MKAAMLAAFFFACDQWLGGAVACDRVGDETRAIVPVFVPAASPMIKFVIKREKAERMSRYRRIQQGREQAGCNRAPVAREAPIMAAIWIDWI